jgi:hypothetical protein
MDTQGNPIPERAPNPNITPDQLISTGTQEQALRPTAAPETAPQQPAPAAPQNTGQPAAAQPPLTANDVAKAIAAAPMPVAPVVPVPQTAADQDVVEPEWVDAAEQTIAHTAGNPYAEEEAVETLQTDYLKKRYGHEVKKPEDK